MVIVNPLGWACKGVGPGKTVVYHLDSLGGKFNVEDGKEVIMFLAEAAAQVDRRSSANKDGAFQYRPLPDARAVRKRLTVKEVKVGLSWQSLQVTKVPCFRSYNNPTV